MIVDVLCPEKYPPASLVLTRFAEVFVCGGPSRTNRGPTGYEPVGVLLVSVVVTVFCKTTDLNRV